jgi:hypothetical protein
VVSGVAEAVSPGGDAPPVDRELDLSPEGAPHVDQMPARLPHPDGGVEARLPAGVDRPGHFWDRTSLALAPAGRDHVDPHGPGSACDGKLPARGRGAAAERPHLRTARSRRRVAAVAQGDVLQK